MTDIFAYISFFYYLCNTKVKVMGMSKIIEYILQHILKKYVNFYLIMLIIPNLFAY